MRNGPTDDSKDGADAKDFSVDRLREEEWNPVAYDPRPGEDGARRTIAYALIGLLSIIVFAVLLLLAFGVVKVTELKDFSVLLGPVITLVSAATGFYYGTKSK